MKPIYTTILLLIANIAFSQDIITSPFIVNGVVQLGEKAKVQFNLNPETTCDSYTIVFDVNHFAKIINVNVNYVYNENCSESFAIITEFPESQLLLTGVYFVNLNLNVVTNPIWNKQTALGSISVVEPSNSNCSNSFIPTLEDFCPPLVNEVCACNGQSYSNECFSYLEDKNGVYTSGSCPSYIIANSIQYSCNSFQSFNHTNFFESYSCDAQIYSGKEIIFTYNHTEFDSLSIEFNSSFNDVTLFLIGLNNNNLNCLQTSNGNKLEFPNLPIGQYYIIADRVNSGDYSVSFCADLVGVQETESKLQISPNPASSFIKINNTKETIKSISIHNSFGEFIGRFTVNSNQEIIQLDYSTGFYLMHIEYENNRQESIKFLISNQ